MGEMSKAKATAAVFAAARKAADENKINDFRDLAREAGVEGRPGGWIYRTETAERPMCQGWARLAADLLLGKLPELFSAMLDAMTAKPTPEPIVVPAPAVEFAGSHAFRPGTEDPYRCDFADCGARVDSRNHDGWPPLSGSDAPVATSPLHRIDDAFEQIQRAARELAKPPDRPDPATDDLDKLVQRLQARINYGALRCVLQVLDDWTSNAARSASFEEGALPLEPGQVTFTRAAVRSMVNDAAIELGTAQVWNGDDA